jgi:hypothetical protein
MNDHDETEEETPGQCLMVSSCCGAPPLGSVDEDAFGQMHGVCSECKQESHFEKDTEDESRS